MKRALVLALLAGAVAAPASATEVTIVPNVGIGKVKLGMTLAQVKRVLGPSPLVNKRAQLPGGRGYIEYGWDFSNNWVGFVNTKGVLHAALIGTSLQKQRTPNGVGVGSPLEMLKRRLRVEPCELRTDGAYHRVSRVAERSEGLYPYCLFGSANERVTVFNIYCNQHDVFYCPGYHVGEVVVRNALLR